MSEQNKMTEEEYLKKHLGSLESKNQAPVSSDIPFAEQPKIDSTRTTDLQYFNFDVKEMPCGLFYPAGTVVMVRPAQVKEIQSYSMVDDNNFYDIVEKMNDMLSACVRVKYLDGSIGSYLDIKDPDRYYLIFLIRELTFQQGSALTTNATCTCNAETAIELNATLVSEIFFQLLPVLLEI